VGQAAGIGSHVRQSGTGSHALQGLVNPASSLTLKHGDVKVCQNQGGSMLYEGPATTHRLLSCHQISHDHDSDEHVTQSNEDTLPRQSLQKEASITVNTNTPIRTGKNRAPRSSEHRRECEKKTVTVNWGEDAVHLLEGSSVNVWQALAKLSKQCTDWGFCAETLNLQIKYVLRACAVQAEPSWRRRVCGLRRGVQSTGSRQLGRAEDDAPVWVMRGSIKGTARLRTP
jgi:hypothetical protein